MNVMRAREPVTLKDFEALKKEDALIYELLDGMVMMSHGPSIAHQKMVVQLLTAINALLPDCQALPDIEVQLAENILVPDLTILCPDAQTTEQRVISPPLLVIEVLSPSSMHRDYMIKLGTYQRLGIAEYWLVDTKAAFIIVHCFKLGQSTTYYREDTLQSCVFPELALDLHKIFP